MIRHLAIVILLFNFHPYSVNGQNSPEPTIAILYPNSLKANDSILQLIQQYTRDIEISEEERNKFVSPKLAPNWKTIREKELEFRQHQDFLSMITAATQANLIYAIIEYHNEPLIFPLRQKSTGALEEYKSIATDHKVVWIINFPNVELTSLNNKPVLKVRMQLYNHVRQKIHINKEYVVDLDYKGELYECEAGTWICGIHNLTPQVVKDIYHDLEKNRRFWH